MESAFTDVCRGWKCEPMPATQTWLRQERWGNDVFQTYRTHMESAMRSERGKFVGGKPFARFASLKTLAQDFEEEWTVLHKVLSRNNGLYFSEMEDGAIVNLLRDVLVSYWPRLGMQVLQGKESFVIEKPMRASVQLRVVSVVVNTTTR